jgi:hypothetical protein
MTRKWFQIHLSTAVVMMLVAGMVVWLNMRGNNATALIFYGWPFTGVIAYDAYWTSPSPGFPNPENPFSYRYDFQFITINILFSIIVVGLSGLVTELIMRRIHFREFKKP